MGTKIQPNTFLREYNDPNRSNNNGLISLYPENQGTFSLWVPRNSHSVYDFAKMRQTILEHESVFKIQLQELHRLYGKQKELMCEIRRGEKTDKDLMLQKLPQTCYGGDVGLSLRTVWRSDTNADSLTLNLLSKGFDQNSQVRIQSAEKLMANNGFVGLFSGNSSVFSQSQVVDSKKDPLGKTEFIFGRKRKLFGVEISDGNEGSVVAELNLLGNHPSEPASQFFCSSVTNSGQNGMPLHKGISDWFPNSDQLKSTPSKNLPWFLKNTQKKVDVNKEMKSSYFMNLESLQNCTHSFFKKSETDDLHQKSNVSVVPIDQIDLNMSFNEVDDSIDLPTTEEDPPVTESEPELCDRLAAEAIIAISQHNEEENSEENDTILKQFAELICCELDETKTTHDGEESIPNGFDFFEFMTLKLEDTKEKHHGYQPLILDDPNVDDSKMIITTRRYSRRGRSRKDFQRDILPSLVTLSRLEISEDLQAFEEVMKAEGRGWRSGISQRGNNRGRKRCVVSSAPSKGKLICSSSQSPQAPPPVCQLQETSLTGWGKRTTRRLPRQRCPNNGFMSFPIKC